MQARSTRRNLSHALVARLEQIEDNAALFHSGRRSAYQGVAIQLRDLLLGARNLVDRVVPDATFHTLPESTMPEFADDGLVTVFAFESRGGLMLGGPMPLLQLDFSHEPLVSRSEFVSQWVLSRELTIHTLIDRTANEEVAHTQDEVGPALQRANMLHFYGRYGGLELHRLAVVSIGSYVAARLRALLQTQETVTA